MIFVISRLTRKTLGKKAKPKRLFRNQREKQIDEKKKSKILKKESGKRQKQKQNRWANQTNSKMVGTINT